MSIRTATSQEVGDQYSKSFLEGFVKQNVKNLTNKKFDFVERIIKKRGTRNDLTDIDAQCTLSKRCNISSLFPAVATIGGCDADHESGDSILFEITAMGGEMAKTTGKIKRKIKTLFSKYKDELPGDLSKVKVCFVYNGADFVDVQENFKSRLFQTYVVHLPIECCIQWKLQVKASKLARRVEVAEAAAKAAAAAAAAAKAEIQLLKARLEALEGPQEGPKRKKSRRAVVATAEVDAL